MVTSPITSPPATTAYPARGDPAAPATEPDERLLGAARRGVRRAPGRPTKSPSLSNFTTRPRPASNGVTVRQLVPVQRHAGLQAQRVPAGQPARDEPDALARLGQRLPQLDRCSAGRRVELEAVLAGVAGAGDQRRHAGDGARRRRVVLQRRRGRRRSGREDRRAARALDGDQRVRVRVVPHLGVEARRPLGQRVEHDLARWRRWRRPCTGPRRAGRRSGRRGCRRSRRRSSCSGRGRRRPRCCRPGRSRGLRRPAGPVTVISPMWERSNSPALVRTAVCSSRSEP